jgi:hypothetical protein
MSVFSYSLSIEVAECFACIDGLSNMCWAANNNQFQTSCMVTFCWSYHMCVMRSYERVSMLSTYTVLSIAHPARTCRAAYDHPYVYSVMARECNAERITWMRLEPIHRQKDYYSSTASSLCCSEPARTLIQYGPWHGVPQVGPKVL